MTWIYTRPHVKIAPGPQTLQSGSDYCIEAMRSSEQSVHFYVEKLVPEGNFTQNDASGIMS